MLFEAHTINAEHKDLIHDVAYDFYGQRMATCSSDHFVKVWDQDERDVWNLTATWKAHSGSVWKVTWAHPEYGQVLATCSFDRTAAVWEEIVGEGTTPGERGMRHWVRRTNLVDSRTSVTDVKFGPKSLGLLLATCSADGVIRIYEAPDVMNLSQWTLQHEISCKLPCSCLSWNPSFSRLHPPMLAVGSDDPNTGSGSKVLIYEYNENSRRWTKTDSVLTVCDPVHDIAFAPNLGRSYHVLAVATKDVRILTLKPKLPNIKKLEIGRFFMHLASILISESEVNELRGFLKTRGHFFKDYMPDIENSFKKSQANIQWYKREHDKLKSVIKESIKNLQKKKDAETRR